MDPANFVLLGNTFYLLAQCFKLIYSSSKTGNRVQVRHHLTIISSYDAVMIKYLVLTFISFKQHFRLKKNLAFEQCKPMETEFAKF